MSETGFNRKFWEIVEANFPQAAHARELDELQRASVRRAQKIELEADEDKEFENFIAASYDRRIADYFLNGDGSEESLIAALQREYKLTEQRTLEAIDRGIGQLHQIEGYGDEA